MAPNADNDEPPTVDQSESARETLNATKTLVFEDCSEGVMALAAAVAAAPRLRRRVWLQDNGANLERLTAAVRMLEGCGIEELYLTQDHSPDLS